MMCRAVDLFFLGVIIFIILAIIGAFVIARDLLNIWVIVIR